MFFKGFYLTGLKVIFKVLFSVIIILRFAISWYHICKYIDYNSIDFKLAQNYLWNILFLLFKWNSKFWDMLFILFLRWFALQWVFNIWINTSENPQNWYFTHINKTIQVIFPVDLWYFEFFSTATILCLRRLMSVWVALHSKLSKFIFLKHTRIKLKKIYIKKDLIF